MNFDDVNVSNSKEIVPVYLIAMESNSGRIVSTWRIDRIEQSHVKFIMCKPRVLQGNTSEKRS